MWLNVRAEEQLIPVNRKSKTLTAEVRFQTLFSRTTSRKPLPEKEMQSKKTPPVIHHCKRPGLWIVTVYAQFCFLCLHTGSSHKTMGYKPLRAFALLQKKLSEHRDEPVWLCLSLHAPHSMWRHWNNKHQMLHYLLQKSKEHICVYGPLVGFIQHDNGILGQIRIYEALPQQHPICHVFDDSLRAGAVLKSNGVANLDREIEQKLKLQNEVTNTINSQFDCSMFVLQTRKQTHNTLAPVLIFPTSPRGYLVHPSAWKLTSCPKQQPNSSDTLFATDMAATLRGWVHPILPLDVYPASARYWVICVVFPDPVSPITIRIWLSCTA